MAFNLITRDKWSFVQFDAKTRQLQIWEIRSAAGKIYFSLVIKLNSLLICRL